MTSNGPKKTKKYKDKDKESIQCSSCNRVITNERYARCLKCQSFFQCLHCFSICQEDDKNGIDIHNPHNLDHEFLIIEPRPNPIYCQNWDVHDEIMLLYGIKLFGIGNWNDIADYMKTKEPIDIETHYTSIYVNSPTAPIPLPEVLPTIQNPPDPEYDTKPVESCPSEAHENHLKVKSQKSNPAEYNGYMPFRHEFEIDFNNDAEHLIADIDFNDGDESKQNFKLNISKLKAYNNVLAERRFRTKVIEDSDIHHREVKSTTKNEKELDPRFLGGFSQEEKAADSVIISIAPYFTYQNTQKMANAIHQKIQFENKIRQRKQWLKCGIRSLPEGILYSNLQNCIKETKIPVISDIGNWNELIANYNRTNEKNVTNKNKNLLLVQESQLCTKEKINPDLYQTLKCLLIRESAIRPLPKQDAIAMDPRYTEEISKTYDLLVSLGIIIV